MISESVIQTPSAWRFCVTLRAYFERDNGKTLSHVVTAGSEAQAVKAAFAHVGTQVRAGRRGQLAMKVLQIVRQ